MTLGVSETFTSPSLLFTVNAHNLFMRLALTLSASPVPALQSSALPHCRVAQNFSESRTHDSVGGPAPYYRALPVCSSSVLVSRAAQDSNDQRKRRVGLALKRREGKTASLASELQPSKSL